MSLCCLPITCAIHFNCFSFWKSSNEGYCCIWSSLVVSGARLLFLKIYRFNLLEKSTEFSNVNQTREHHVPNGSCLHGNTAFILYLSLCFPTHHTIKNLRKNTKNRLLLLFTYWCCSVETAPPRQSSKAITQPCEFLWTQKHLSLRQIFAILSQV